MYGRLSLFCFSLWLVAAPLFSENRVPVAKASVTKTPVRVPAKADRVETVIRDPKKGETLDPSKSTEIAITPAKTEGKSQPDKSEKVMTEEKKSEIPKTDTAEASAVDPTKTQDTTKEKPKLIIKSEVVKVDKRRDRVSITDDPNRNWVRKDSVCIYRSRVLACGKVIAVGIKGAVVQLNPHPAAIKAGDEVRYFDPDKKIPQITDEELASETLLEAKPYSYNFALGYLLSWDLNYPLAHFYWTVNPSVAVGIQGAYVKKSPSAGASLSGYGGALTVNYFGDEYFRGMWLHFGSGFYRLTATDLSATETLNVPILTFLVGWREDWAHGLNVGAGAGLRYLSSLSGAVTGVTYSAPHLIAVIEIGFGF